MWRRDHGEAAKEHYVGLDVSLKQTAICIVDRVGKISCEATVASDPSVIAKFVRSNAPSAVRVGLETGPTATWLWTELKLLGLPVVCIDARHAKAVLRMQVNKSDRNDAAGIAHHADGLVQGSLCQELRQPCDPSFAGEPGSSGQDEEWSREPGTRHSEEALARDRWSQVQRR